MSANIRSEIESVLSNIRTPVWPIIDTVENGGIKRPPFDVPQAWINNTIKHQLERHHYDTEVLPFAGGRPITLGARSEGGSDQAIDFEKIFDGKRHVIEVELGNVASLYRSIHKLCLAMEENSSTVAILIIPDNDLISRCEPASAMSNHDSAVIVISEFAYYYPGAASIHIIEFSSDIEVNLQHLVDDNQFWRGNFSNTMREYLTRNIHQFLR